MSHRYGCIGAILGVVTLIVTVLVLFLLPSSGDDDVGPMTEVFALMLAVPVFIFVAFLGYFVGLGVAAFHRWRQGASEEDD